MDRESGDVYRPLPSSNLTPSRPARQSFQMAQPSSTPPSSSSSDADLLQQTVKTALAQIEMHAPQKDKALLRAMLEYAPSDQGKLSIASDILQFVDANNVSTLDKLADSYWVNIILPSASVF